MTGEAQRGDHWKRRFPGFSVVGQADHWDDATRAVVLARLEPPRPITYLPEELRPTGVALVAQLVAVDGEFALALLASIDERLATNQTDGWHYDDMPIDHDVWKRSLAGLDADAAKECGSAFSDADEEQQQELLERVRTSDATDWHGMPPGRVWNLWMRYVCTAYYAHPSAWDEMGFPGPAYPRGYKNTGIDAREPFEVADTMPHMDPTVSSAP
ncbi:gluconate 2-dehydrogenase subunit 3 family protein [Amnibacterium sp.]|uniref:gluconate 2-dehydrogenase subunit 3 family protein n=1 Tax=Amnibacterium sp. TaxID=1872496 RepID=UPI003F7BD192